ncbi:hypothetical protein CDL15_Pgr011662 [Punica granatum]|uniref:Uncharacterized protein n=1 Tax=Punica granatum TaxID=22663 RepID=A0A218WVR7_PUNGR|nr:hypothetical protein CDL15_Pgr011662 [Punica granatum]
MAFCAPRRLLGKPRRVLLSDLPNCVCPLEFSRQYGVNFVCHYSIRPVSDYALPKRVVTWTTADNAIKLGEPKWGADNLSNDTEEDSTEQRVTIHPQFN